MKGTCIALKESFFWAHSSADGFLKSHYFQISGKDSIGGLLNHMVQKDVSLSRFVFPALLKHRLGTISFQDVRDIKNSSRFQHSFVFEGSSDKVQNKDNTATIFWMFFSISAVNLNLKWLQYFEEIKRMGSYGILVFGKTKVECSRFSSARRS